jgi:hypothetical protein
VFSGRAEMVNVTEEMAVETLRGDVEGLIP